MSRIWGADAAIDAAPVAVAGFRPVEGGFRSLYTAPAGQQTAALRGELVPVEPVDVLEEARMEAFTMGFEEGCRITAEAQADAVEAQGRLSEALELLAPAPKIGRAHV